METEFELLIEKDTELYCNNRNKLLLTPEQVSLQEYPYTYLQRC